MKVLLQILMLLLPWIVRRQLLSKFLGFRIDPSARIGYSVIISAEVDLGKNSSIGHLTFIKGLQLVELAESAKIGNLNWISAFPLGFSRHFSHVEGRFPRLLIGKHSALTNRHLIDCTDSVSIGEYSTFGGFRSQILTHSVDVEHSRQDCQPVKIGDFCFVGTGVCILGGAILPDRCVLAAGSVLLPAPNMKVQHLYGGVPAKLIKPLSDDLKYYSRKIGFIW